MTPTLGPIAPINYLALIESRANLDMTRAHRDRALRLHAEVKDLYDAIEEMSSRVARDRDEARLVWRAVCDDRRRAERKAREWTRAKWVAGAFVALNVAIEVWRVYG